MRDAWLRYLAQARWFGAKGLDARVTELRELGWYVDDGDAAVRSELASVELPEATQTYHLLVGYLPAGTAEPDALVGRTRLPGRGEVDVVDAPRSPTAMAALLRAIARPDVAGVAWREAPPAPDLPVSVFAGEQSNTTVLIDGDVLMKVFRKLPDGPGVEAGLLDALGGTGLAPRLIGTIQDPGSGRDLALFCERVPDASDGWTLLTRACERGEPAGELLCDLGATLRRLHLALADRFGAATVPAATVTGAMHTRLDDACADAPELANLREPLSRVFGEVGDEPVEVQRIHGDFHLGQALFSPRGWTVIDFEGEPLKTSAQRRAPDSRWRDVAGVLRSLDYARQAHADPDGPAALAWVAAARADLLRGYVGTAGDAPALLHAYEVDKAIYEFVYETRNRPDWARIPRHALEVEATTVRKSL